MLKKSVVNILVTCVILLIGIMIVSAELPDRPIQIYYSPPTYDMSDWWGKFGQNLQNELKKQGIDYNMVFRAPITHASHDQQYNIILDFIAAEPDFILMGPTELYAQMGAYRKINEKEIPLIILNYTIPFPEEEGIDVLSWVGYSHRYGGELAGEWIVDWFNDEKDGKGKIAVIYGNPGSLTEDRYGKTTKVIIEKNLPDVKFVYEGGAEYNRVKAYKAAQDIMVGFPDVDMIYCISSAMAVGALAAVKDAGKDIAVIGWGGIDEELELIWAGELTACVFRGEYSTAEAVVDIFQKYFARDLVPKIYVTKMAMLSSREDILENVEDYRLEALGFKK